MFTPNQKDKKSLAEQRRSNPSVGFGTSFAVGMAVFALGGHWLDVKYDREPLFTLVGIGLGFLYGAWELWKLIAMSNERAENKDPGETKNEDHPSNEPPQ